MILLLAVLILILAFGGGLAISPWFLLALLLLVLLFSGERRPW